MASDKGCFINLLKIFFIALIVLVVAVVSLFFLATGSPATYPAPAFTGGDTGVVANIITRLARSLVDKEGRVVETAVLRLSESEVQTLLDAAIAKAINNDPRPLPYQVTWEAGKLYVLFSSPSLFLGRAINLSVDFSPVVDNGVLTLTPESGTFGHFPMMRKGLDTAAKRLEEAAMRNDNTRTTLSAFKRIEPGEDGTLVLMFDPRDVNTVVRILKSAGEPQTREELDRDKDDDEDDEDDVIEEDDRDDADPRDTEDGTEESEE